MKSRSSRRWRGGTGCSDSGRRKSSGLSGDAVAAYAKEVVAADFEEKGDDDVLRKVEKDFAAKGVELTQAEIRAKMNELLAEAINQLKAGK